MGIYLQFKDIIESQVLSSSVNFASNMTHFTLAVLGLLVVFASSSFAIKCYTAANKGGEKECGDLSCMKTAGNNKAEYGCALKKHDDGCTEVGPATLCYCNTDLCNSSLRINSSYGLAIVLMAVAFLYKHL